MKLIKDFGVRALFGTMIIAGFYMVLMYVLVSAELSVDQVIALVAMPQAALMLAVGFYFGQKKSE